MCLFYLFIYDFGLSIQKGFLIESESLLQIGLQNYSQAFSSMSKGY